MNWIVVSGLVGTAGGAALGGWIGRGSPGGVATGAFIGGLAGGSGFALAAWQLRGIVDAATAGGG
ncbi:MAG: hypothetical protein ACOCUS_00785 [Polyangiales bacterium]